MLSEGQKLRDKLDGLVSVECPRGLHIADRRPIQEVERTDELIGVVCGHCGHRFDWVVPKGDA
jgi:hypothetical protein